MGIRHMQSAYLDEKPVEKEVNKPRKGRIKLGSKIAHDRSFCHWPGCWPPAHQYEGMEYKPEARDPNMVFTIKPFSKNSPEKVLCSAPGFGDAPYGSGKVLANACDIEFLDDEPQEQEKSEECITKEQFHARQIARRKAFELWIMQPPFEMSIMRFGSDAVWPNQYVDYQVQLLWCAWIESAKFESLGVK